VMSFAVAVAVAGAVAVAVVDAVVLSSLSCSQKLPLFWKDLLQRNT
jgi:hypothetical protein